MHTFRRVLGLLAFSNLAFLGAISSEPLWAGLLEYVREPDSSFSWKYVGKQQLPDGTVYNLKLVSQKWHGITWKHDLQIFVPKGCKPGKTVFLWNQGGRPSAVSTALGMQFAKEMRIPVAFLYGIPNQPLLGNLREDALIAETFVRYLKTKDESWPLLFPMVKSLVRAMDAIQAFARQEWNVAVTEFIVSGASKRGWTTWLTAAADRRVKAIAPLVIDTLNMRQQMVHQLKSFGKFSRQIHDYVERGLVPPPPTKEAERLWRMVDPYNYLDRIKVPVMIINGANDPYWTVDALNLYWNAIKSSKWVLYVPNAGHGLDQKKAFGLRDRVRATRTLVAFVRHVVKQNPMPRLRWRFEETAERSRIRITASEKPKAARLWVVSAPTKDFRNSTWREVPLLVIGNTVTGDVSRPKQGYVAYFAELEFQINGKPYYLSTQVRILESRKPKDSG